MDYTTYFLLLFLSTSITCERLHEQIYATIEGGAACFRRLNGTHQAGCSSSDNGAVGVVQLIKDVTDAKWLIFNGTAGPYMAVVSTSLFHDVIELFMNHPTQVAGVLIYDNATESPESFSQESRCPNEYSSMKGSLCSTADSISAWNAKGTGLMRRDIPFPMFFLPQSQAVEIENIEKCYQRYNLDKSNQNGKPLCSLQLNSFMFAAVNTEVCLRRSATTALLTPTKVCDPLSDQNVYYSLFPRIENETNNESVILVTARIDSASLFDGLSPGAASSVVGMVTFITAAATLSQMIKSEPQQYKGNVMWTLLNGESFDYIGSQRVAYDVARGAWPAVPLSAARVALHLDVGQLGGALRPPTPSTPSTRSAAWDLYALTYNAKLPQIQNFISEMDFNVKKYNMTLTPKFEISNLPPSSLHSFRRILKKEIDEGLLPELLLVDHDETFTNKFYQSVLDDFDKIDFVYHNISIGSDGKFLPTEELIANGTMKVSDTQVKMSRLATALASTLYQRLSGKRYDGAVTASAHLVDEMLYCFLRSQACRLLLAAEWAAGGAEAVEARPPPLYVGVAAWPGTAPVLAAHVLALLTGTHSTHNRTACLALHDPGLSNYYLQGWNHSGVCIQTTMNFSQALSPAFLIPDYDMRSHEFSTWTESVWQAMYARVFVRAGGGGARAAGSLGAAAMLLALALTAWLARHKRTLFVPAPASAPAPMPARMLRTVNC